MSYTEDLLPLLLDEQSGKPVVNTARWDIAIGGAVLLDLVRTGHVTVRRGAFNNRKAVVNDDTIDGDAVRDQALRTLAGKSVSTRRAVQMLSKRSRRSLVDLMVRQGSLRVSESKVLGIFPVSRWYLTDDIGTTELRCRIGEVLRGDEPPDERLGGLIALLSAIGATTRVVPGNRSRLHKRAKEIARGHWANDAVRAAVQQVTAAVAAAGATGGAGGADGGGGGGGGGG